MAEYWAGQGRAVTIVTLRRDPPTEYAIPEGVVLKRLNLIAESNPFWSPAHVFSLIRLRRELVRLRPDVVISFIDKLNVAVILALTGTNIPVVATEHLTPWMNPLGWAWNMARGVAYKGASSVISPNHAMTQWFRSRFEGRFVSLPYPANLAGFHKPADRRKVILGVGRLSREKGFDLLIDAFSQLKNQFPEWSVEIAGQGPERVGLERLVLENELSARVRFLGQVADVKSLFSRAEVFVLPSRHEAYPMALCEAMSAGCCVIASDCPSGVVEITGREGAAVIVAPENTDALAQALERVLTNPALRRDLSRRVSARASTFGSAVVMPNWDKLLDLTVNARRAGENCICN
jgi:glycosyltransferase involved in cell wall biosynthesis